MDTGDNGELLRNLGFPLLNLHSSYAHYDFVTPGRRVLVIGPMGSGKTEFSARIWRDSTVALRKKGLAVIEAMSRALPVVASGAGGHLESVGSVPGAALYDPAKPAEAGEWLQRRHQRHPTDAARGSEEHGDERALLAYEMYSNSAKKFIGQYIAVMGGVDCIVLTGGVGENSAKMRRMIFAGLQTMGIVLDNERNRTGPREREISTDESEVLIVIIPTDEELMIARETFRVITAA